jgi:hypothetical protein
VESARSGPPRPGLAASAWPATKAASAAGMTRRAVRSQSCAGATGSTMTRSAIRDARAAAARICEPGSDGRILPFRSRAHANPSRRGTGAARSSAFAMSIACAIERRGYGRVRVAALPAAVRATVWKGRSHCAGCYPRGQQRGIKTNGAEGAAFRRSCWAALNRDPYDG